MSSTGPALEHPFFPGAGRDPLQGASWTGPTLEHPFFPAIRPGALPNIIFDGLGSAGPRPSMLQNTQAGRGGFMYGFNHSYFEDNVSDEAFSPRWTPSPFDTTPHIDKSDKTKYDEWGERGNGDSE